jgi:hypothetical protein
MYASRGAEDLRGMSATSPVPPPVLPATLIRILIDNII